MTRPIFCIVTILLYGSCSNANSDNLTAINQSDTISLAKKDTTTITKILKTNSDKLDSVNRANSNTITVDENNIQKATVSKSDSSIWLTSNIKLDHRIFGYDKPDTSSKKMILISVFTNDVEGNPFKCEFGSYYQTSDMNNMELKYISTEGQFVKANIIKDNSIKATIYIYKKWIEFDKYE